MIVDKSLVPKRCGFDVYRTFDSTAIIVDKDLEKIQVLTLHNLTTFTHINRTILNSTPFLCYGKYSVFSQEDSLIFIAPFRGYVSIDYNRSCVSSRNICRCSRLLDRIGLLSIAWCSRCILSTTGNSSGTGGVNGHIDSNLSISGIESQLVGNQTVRIKHSGIKSLYIRRTGNGKRFRLTSSSSRSVKRCYDISNRISSVNLQNTILTGSNGDIYARGRFPRLVGVNLLTTHDIVHETFIRLIFLGTLVGFLVETVLVTTNSNKS